jgi:hypothetical protein
VSIRLRCSLAAASSNHTGQLEKPQLLLGNLKTIARKKHQSPTPPLLKPLQRQLDRRKTSSTKRQLEKLTPCDTLICCAFVCSLQPAVSSSSTGQLHRTPRKPNRNNLANFLHPLRPCCWNFTKRKRESNSIDTNHCSCLQPMLLQTFTFTHILATLLVCSRQMDRFAREK